MVYVVNNGDRHLNLEQLKYDINAWHRILEFIKQENLYLKNRFATVIQSKIDKSFLEEAESFQNNFINTDTVLLLFKNDITKFEKQLSRSVKDDSKGKEIAAIQKQYGNDIEKLENEFLRLRASFNAFIDKFYTPGVTAWQEK